MDISELKVNKHIGDALSKANVSRVSTVLTTPPFELNRKLKLDPKDCEELIKIGSRAVLLKEPVSAFQMLQDMGGVTEQKWDVGCPILNSFLNGGLTKKGVTEISGISGSGKTQLCLQLSLTAQKSITDGGLSGAVAYVCTEGFFRTKRLHDIILQRQKLKYLSREKPLASFTDNLFIECVSDVEGLEECVDRRLPLLVQNHNVKLVIIDSVAALFRVEFERSEGIDKSQKLYSLGSSLAKLNAVHNVVIICVNQVTDIISEDEDVSQGGGGVVPSLGLAWSNVVSTRIMLSRTEIFVAPKSLANVCDRAGPEPTLRKRKLEIVFSPTLEPKCCYFYVDASGVHGLQNDKL